VVAEEGQVSGSLPRWHDVRGDVPYTGDVTRAPAALLVVAVAAEVVA
jgi:hypothetical protein